MTTSLMRPRQGAAARTTNVELFFDLVYVFATTQLSHRLLAEPTFDGAVGAGLLLAMVWQAWVYTTWVTNWLDPDRLPVRVALLVLMAGSLALSAALPQAFGARGLMVGAAYAFVQIGRSIFAVVAITDDTRLRRNFERVLCWCVVSGALALLGGLVHGAPRGGCWVAAVAVDVTGGLVGFPVPGLGRSVTSDWTIEGNHFAERCQAFLLIALGEAVVVIGEALSERRLSGPSTTEIFPAAFVGCCLLWWVYFDRSAERSAEVIARSEDPGRLGRSAYHFIHPVMVAGIIVTAAADERVIEHPSARTDPATAWMVLGGVGLFVLGHGLFKLAVWRRVPWTRVGVLVLLAALGIGATHLAAWLLGTLAGVVLLALVVADRLVAPPADPGRLRPG